MSPTWTHRGCGGEVFMRVNGQEFACRKCHHIGQLGAEMPEGMTPGQQMQYLVTQVKEVDLVPMQSGFFFLGF